LKKSANPETVLGLAYTKYSLRAGFMGMSCVENYQQKSNYLSVQKCAQENLCPDYVGWSSWPATKHPTLSADKNTCIRTLHNMLTQLKIQNVTDAHHSAKFTTSCDLRDV